MVQFASASRPQLRQRLRSTSFNYFKLPQLRSKFGERAFSHAGPSAWNSLPDSIRTEPNSAVFRKHLKTHFSVQHLTFVNLLFIDCTQRWLCNAPMSFCNRRIINVRWWWWWWCCCYLENGVRVRSRSLELAPFDRSHIISYSPSIVTMVICCIVCDI